MFKVGFVYFFFLEFVKIITMIITIIILIVIIIIIKVSWNPQLLYYSQQVVVWNSDKYCQSFTALSLLVM